MNISKEEALAFIDKKAKELNQQQEDFINSVMDFHKEHCDFKGDKEDVEMCAAFWAHDAMHRIAEKAEQLMKQTESLRRRLN